MKNKLCKFVSAIITSVVLISSLNINAFAVTYFENVEREILGRAMSTEVVRSVTDKGMLDVYVLRVPTGDPYIKIKPVESAKESQLKEPTSVILQENGAIAGVNGDFFNLSGAYSAPIGAFVSDGKIKVVDSVTNVDKNSFATLFVGKDGNPLIRYIKSETVFLVEGSEKIKVYTINKLRDLSQPVYVDRNYANDTQKIDAQFPGLSKVVVDKGVITKIAKNGEVVEIPENGFVVLIKKESSDYFTSLVSIGQKASISVKSYVDFSQMEAAIGGGGKILTEGKLAADEGYVPGGRQPRTAVGYNKEKTEMILMVVDGRSHSIGASQAEMAELMLKYGAYEAMNFDGGGSSTFAVKNKGESTVKTINTPSEGRERKVVNALGIFYDAPPQQPTSITVKPAEERVFKGTGIPVNIFGIDQYFNTILLDSAQMGFACDDGGAKYENGYFFPSVTGDINLIATFSGTEGTGKVVSKELAQIIPAKNNINTGVGGRQVLEFTGKSTDGYNAYIYKGVFCEVVPNTLGHIEGNEFVADSLGAGYIKCSVGNVTSYIDVNVGYQNVQLTSFENNIPINSTVYPAGPTASSYYTEQTVSDGKFAVKMDYNFVQSEITQAAYTIFSTPIQLKQGAISLKLSVFGDNSSHWLRARLLDADGNESMVDLAKAVDWEGWKELTVTLPEGIKQPVSLERIYAVSLSNPQLTSNSLIFDNLGCTMLVKYDKVQHPQDSLYMDKVKVDLNTPSKTGYDITVIGDVSMLTDKKPENYVKEQSNLINSAKKNSKGLIIAGSNDVNEDSASFLWKNFYQMKELTDASVISVSGEKGGISLTSPGQYGYFPKDIEKSEKKVIIVTIDKSPLNFTHFKEYELFQSVMEKAVKAGKSVFVVSSEGNTNSVNTRNGVRYINLGGLWDKDGKPVKANILKIRIEPEGVNFDIQ